MSYRVLISPKAEKQIRKLDAGIRARIGEFVLGRLRLLEDPRTLGKALVGVEFWRYRVGDYRILASIDDESVTVLVVEVAHRREVHKG